MNPSLPPNSMHDWQRQRDALIASIRELGRVVVAFSAGVDSTVVAKAAQLAVGDNAIAVTGVSPSMAGGELDEARRLAALIGIRHEIVETQEFQSPQYTRNAADRCFHCKTELYTQIEHLLPRSGAAVVLNGANADDFGDHRPGMRAATDFRVRSPLAECGIDKAGVRLIAADWQLPIWDKPATPCLSSRIAYGEQVTPDRLAMIDRAEQHLRGLGMREVRVRYHRGDLARIEVPVDELPRLCQPAARLTLVAKFQEFGFRFVTLDLQGFRSGSLNALVPVESLQIMAAEKGDGGHEGHDANSRS